MGKWALWLFAHNLVTRLGLGHAPNIARARTDTATSGRTDTRTGIDTAAAAAGSMAVVGVIALSISARGRRAARLFRRFLLSSFA